MKEFLKKSMIYFSLAIIAIALTTSCSKDEDSNGSDNPEDLLTSKTWVLSSVSSDSDDAMVLLVVAILNYMKDSEYVFNADGTYTITFEGESESGDWEYTESSKTLLLDGEPVTIASISSSAMTWNMEIVVDEDSGETANTIWTFSAK